MNTVAGTTGPAAIPTALITVSGEVNLGHHLHVLNRAISMLKNVGVYPQITRIVIYVLVTFVT